MFSRVLSWLVDPQHETLAAGIVSTALAQVFGASTSLTIAVAAVFGGIVAVEKALGVKAPSAPAKPEA